MRASFSRRAASCTPASSGGIELTCASAIRAEGQAVQWLRVSQRSNCRPAAGGVNVRTGRRGGLGSAESTVEKSANHRHDADDEQDGRVRKKNSEREAAEEPDGGEQHQAETAENPGVQSTFFRRKGTAISVGLGEGRGRMGVVRGPK